MGKKQIISLSILICSLLSGCSTENSVIGINTSITESAESGSVLSETTSALYSSSEQAFSSQKISQENTNEADINTSQGSQTITCFTSDEPNIAWTETVFNQTLHINKNGVYSLNKALDSGTRVKKYALNQAVRVKAYTSTGYYKLSDSEFIYIGYLSSEKTYITTQAAPKPIVTAAPKPVVTAAPKPVVTAAPKPVITTTTPKPVVTTPKPVVTTTEAPVVTTDPLVDEFIGKYNQRRQEQWEIEYADKVFELTNKIRRENNLPEFKKLDSITKIAATRAWEILVDYRSDHSRPDGKPFYSIYEENGLNYSNCGENIAAGFGTPEDVVDAWMNSTGHRKNILSDKYTYLGVGYYKNPNDPDLCYSYWTQEFCSLYN